MKSLFPGYYQPAEKEFSEMWQEGVFAFDANVLLHTYRYTPETRASFFNALERLGDRIWLPYQAANEFQVRRLQVISDQEKAYAAVENLFDEARRRIKAGLDSYRMHTYLDVKRLLKSLDDEFQRARQGLEKVKAQHPNYLNSDPLRERITALFEGKVGNSYDEKRLAESHSKAEQRFASSVPPGYKDAKKDKPQRYGDVIIWFQLIDYAISNQKPMFFITDDRKEDWWLIHEGKTIGPRPELIQEMYSKAGIQFYIYPSDQFLKYAQRFLSIKDQESAIEEVKEIRERDEANRIALSELPYWGEATWGEAFGVGYPSFRRAIEMQDERAVEMARRLAGDPPYETAVRQLMELQSRPAYQAIMRELEKLESNPGYEAAKEVQSNPALEATIREAQRLESNPAYRTALEMESNPAIKAALREAQRLASDPTYRRLVEEIAKRRF